MRSIIAGKLETHFWQSPIEKRKKNKNNNINSVNRVGFTPTPLLLVGSWVLLAAINMRWDNSLLLPLTKSPVISSETVLCSLVTFMIVVKLGAFCSFQFLAIFQALPLASQLERHVVEKKSRKNIDLIRPANGIAAWKASIYFFNIPFSRKCQKYVKLWQDRTSLILRKFKAKAPAESSRVDSNRHSQ